MKIRLQYIMKKGHHPVKKLPKGKKPYGYCLYTNLSNSDSGNLFHVGDFAAKDKTTINKIILLAKTLTDIRWV